MRTVWKLSCDMDRVRKLLLVFIIAFLIRLAMNVVFQGLHAPPDINMGGDAIEYDLIAREICKGGNYTDIYRPPGTSFLLSIIYYLFGVKYAIVRTIFSLLGAATCIIVYFIGKKIFNETVGMVSAALLAVYPNHFYYSMHLLSETPWAFFMSLAVLSAILLQEKEALIFSVLFGLFIGVCSYIRPISIIYIPITALLCSMYYFPINRKRFLLFCFAPFMFTLLIILPWTIRNYKLTNHFILISANGGTTFWYATNEEILNNPKLIGGIVEDYGQRHRGKTNNNEEMYIADKMGYQRGFEFVKTHLKDMPKLELMKLYRLITPFYETPNRLFNLIGGLSWAILLPFCIIGIIIVLRNKLFLSLHAVLVLIIFIALAYYGSHRFLASIAPFLMIYSSIGLWEMLHYFKIIKRHL